VAALADEMNTASARNAAKERLKSDWDRAANAVTGWRAEVEKAERELVDLREKVIQVEVFLSHRQPADWVPGSPLGLE
jgi:hypothetical protein